MRFNCHLSLLKPVSIPCYLKDLTLNLIFIYMVKKIIILASGGGTNAENIIRYFQENNKIEVHSVLCNRKEAGVYDRVKCLNVTCQWFDAKNEDVLMTYMNQHQPDLIVLAGYLRKIPDDLIQAYPNKIINIHPALLPKYGGKGMFGMHVHKAVKAAAETQSGISIHYVNEHYDEGAIILQNTVQLDPKDSPEVIAAKVQQLEYAHFPLVIEQLLS